MAMRVKDVMTKNPVTVCDTDTIMTVAKQMAAHDIGDVLVCDQNGGLMGIVTDRDIVVRAMAQSKDPATTCIGDIATRDLECLRPDDEITEAVDTMRDKAIRRIPVVDGKNPVGIVSLGDVAQARDAESCLGQISAAPPGHGGSEVKR